MGEMAVVGFFSSKQERLFEPAYINITIELVGVVLSGNVVEGEIS